ncbi:MAG: hypothetical protein AABW91_01355 [Nanoarchaeota archaeon]
MNLNSMKSFIVSHKATSLLFATALAFALFQFISSTTFVREVPMGQGLPMEGQTIYGCKSCSGFAFFSSFSCSTNIMPNCFLKFTWYFIEYAIIALIIGIIIDWIIGKIKSKK